MWNATERGAKHRGEEFAYWTFQRGLKKAPTSGFDSHVVVVDGLLSKMRLFRLVHLFGGQDASPACVLSSLRVGLACTVLRDP